MLVRGISSKVTPDSKKLAHSGFFFFFFFFSIVLVLAMLHGSCTVMDSGVTLIATHTLICLPMNNTIATANSRVHMYA